MECFYFYDCPRTGGTSVKRWTKNQHNLKRIHYGSPKPWHHVPFKHPSIIEKELRPRGYTGRISTMTLLRDPCAHTISLYAKIRNHKHAYASKFKRIGFAEWIQGDFKKDVAETPNPWGFSMVRFYDPETGDLEKAIRNIEAVDFVGFTERLNVDMNKFLVKIGLSITFSGNRLNISRKGGPCMQFSEEEVEIIKRVRADDYRLVNYFREKRGLELYV
jgi:hypothetical protein